MIIAAGVRKLISRAMQKPMIKNSILCPAFLPAISIVAILTMSNAATAKETAPKKDVKDFGSPVRKTIESKLIQPVLRKLILHSPLGITKAEKG